MLGWGYSYGQMGAPPYCAGRICVTQGLFHSHSYASSAANTIQSNLKHFVHACSAPLKLQPYAICHCRKLSDLIFKFMLMVAVPGVVKLRQCASVGSLPGKSGSLTLSPSSSESVVARVYLHTRDCHSSNQYKSIIVSNLVIRLHLSSNMPTLCY